MEISRATYHMEYILYIEIIRMLTSYLELMCFVRVCVDALKPYVSTSSIIPKTYAMYHVFVLDIYFTKPLV